MRLPPLRLPHLPRPLLPPLPPPLLHQRLSQHGTSLSPLLQLVLGHSETLARASMMWVLAMALMTLRSALLNPLLLVRRQLLRCQCQCRLPLTESL